jgi:predicted oxidoreductase
LLSVWNLARAISRSQDFEPFVAAGITSLDAADHYGPAEALIGRYLAAHPERREAVQVTLLVAGAGCARLARAARFGLHALPTGVTVVMQIRD